MRSTFTVAVAILAVTFPCGLAQERPVWNYKCIKGFCEKQAVKDGDAVQALSVCKILCNPDAMLWPKPSGKIILSRTLVPVSADKVTFKGVDLEEKSRVNGLLEQATARFRTLFSRKAQLADITTDKTTFSIHLEIIIQDPNVISLAVGVDESYDLELGPAEDKKITATIKAATFFGARHALETLSQLVVSDDVTHNLLLFSEANITDAPVFQYRGVNLDTSRNYLSVSSILRTLEGMAMNKLNTFHWHMTDSQSWPFVSDSFPQLSRYGAYSQKQVYTPGDIRTIVEYARVRGIRVIPELDAPAHVGEGFQWTEPGTIVCFKAQPWKDFCVEPPCGQLNPSSEQVYTILSGVYADMLRVFDSDVFHMGGDEVSIDCWNSSTPVLEGMAKLGYNQTKEGFFQLWDYFQRRAFNALVEANGGKKLPVIMWTSGLTEHGNLDKYLDKETYIIEIWTKGDDPHVAELVNKGYRVIFSNYEALYLDCGFAGWVTGGNNWCSPFIGWQKVYDNSPYKLLDNLNVSSSEAKRLTMGAEASLWTEQSDDASLDNRLWPRVAAMAERLWSDPKTGWMEAESRMLNQRQRLQDMGFYPNRLQPQWCHQNEGYCPI